MQNRIGLGIICVLCGVVAGQFFAPRDTTAQIGNNRGFFSSLKVGDMVETAFDGAGKTVLRTYDDDLNRAKMIAKVVDIGGEHIVLEIKASEANSKEAWTIRYPIHSIGSIFHVTGASAAGPAGDGNDSGEPAKPKKDGGIKTKKAAKS